MAHHPRSIVPSRRTPLSGSQRTLATAQLVSAIGDGAYYTSSALYFTRIVGLSPTRLGLGLAVAWAIGSVAGVPLGHLADRRGPRGTAAALAFVTAAVVASFLVVDDFLPFLVAACLYATAQSGLGAARQALVGGLVPEGERTAALARLQATLNAGLAVGAALGGVALTVGTRAAFLAAFTLTALGFLATGLILLRLPAVIPVLPATVAAGGAGADGATARKGRDGGFAVLADRRYAVVTLVNTVLLLRMPLLSLVIPLWIADRAPQLGWLGSALFVLNTVGVTLFQVRTARAVTGLPSAARAVRQAGAVLLASCAVFALSAAPVPVWAMAALLVGGAVLQVFGEMKQSAGSWQIAFDLAPADRLGQYQGFFGTGVAVARTAGPLLLTTLLLDGGGPGWLVLGVLFLAAGCAMGPAVRYAERDRSSWLAPAPATAPLAPTG
ncbi:MFS transporter [Kitasatospora purpeofusca]|uniref:MFS transporter n=1 Tax=Kitasatospora purpeofusca TaxID=67352 RepID=UPI00224FB63D|nr:MFS transporter [Kitasatospora purpeofusca]MCX4756041.1 MFS transporter [Kitasatospora purpeofusca]WSR36116.1 MFS transporter [Kitasatospora purpeofusca]